jgi:hypothetical protein
MNNPSFHKTNVVYGHERQVTSYPGSNEPRKGEFGGLIFYFLA